MGIAVLSLLHGQYLQDLKASMHVQRRYSHLLQSGLDGKLGRVPGVHPTDERIDKPLERFPAEVPRDEFFDAFLVVRGRGQHQPDSAQPSSVTKQNKPKQFVPRTKMRVASAYECGVAYI